MEPSELEFGTIYVHDRDSNFSLLRMLEFCSALRGMDIIPVPDDDATVPTLVARRMNLGNLGHAAVVRMALYGYDDPQNTSSSPLMRSLMNFADVLTDVTATDSGDCEVYCNLSRERGRASRIFPSKLREKTIAGVGLGFQVNVPGALNDTEACQECVGGNAEVEYEYCKAPERDPLGEREENETLSLEAEKQDAFDQLKRAVLNFVIVHKKDPTQLIQQFIQGKYVIGADGLSPLLVNGDLEIVLPGYDEVCVRMPALCRAIYILFLKHRHDGIVLKHFADYRSEFEEIYSMVMPGRDERLAASAIDNLCNPMSSTLQEYISRIKRCFTTVLVDSKLLAHYIIMGPRGESYKIQLPDELVTLPAALTA